MSYKTVTVNGQAIRIDDHEGDVWRWLYPCPYFQEMFFGFADLDQLNGQVVILPFSLTKDSQPITQYIDGSTSETYTPFIQWYDTVATKEPNTEANINQLNDRLKTIWYWIKAQLDAGNLPDIDNIGEVEVKPPTIAGQDEKGIKCQFALVIHFKDEEQDDIFYNT